MSTEILPFSHYSQLKEGNGYVFDLQTDLFSLSQGKYFGILTSISHNGCEEKSCVYPTTYYTLQFDSVLSIPTAKEAHTLHITVCPNDPEYLQIYKDNGQEIIIKFKN